MRCDSAKAICIDDAVVVSATRPENVLTNDGTTMRIVAKVLGRPSAWLRQDEVLFDDERLEEAKAAKEVDSQGVDAPEAIEAGKKSTGEQDKETADSQQRPDEPEPALGEGNEDTDVNTVEKPSVKEPPSRTETKLDVTSKSERDAETSVKSTSGKSDEKDVKQEEAQGKNTKKSKKKPIKASQDTDVAVSKEKEEASAKEELPVEEADGARKGEETREIVSESAAIDAKAPSAKDAEAADDTVTNDGASTSKKDVAGTGDPDELSEKEPNSQDVDKSSKDAVSTTETAVPTPTPAERQAAKKKQLVQFRADERGSKRALHAATKYSSGMTLDEMADKHKSLEFAKRKSPLLGKPGTREYQVEDSHGVSQTVSYTSRFVDKLSEITEDMGISASMSVKFGTIAGSARGSFIDTDKFKESDLNFYISVKVVNQSVNFRDALEFNRLDNIAEDDFTKTFGDSFISGFQEGGEFNALVSMKVLNKDKLMDIKAEASVALNAGAAEIKADANVRIAKSNLALNTETTIQVSWQGGGLIKPPEETWNIESLQRAAMRFPDNVAASPQRIYAILTKYESLRSFQAIKPPSLSPLNYENVALYTNELMDTFMSYKSLYRRLTTHIYDIQNGTLQFVTIGQDERNAKQLSDAVKASGLDFYPSTMDGLDSARSEIRRQMNCIVIRVDLLAEEPHKLGEKETFISAVAFETIVPPVEPVARRATSSTPLTGVKFAPVTEKPDGSTSSKAEASEEDKAGTSSLCYTPAELRLSKDENDLLKSYLLSVPGIADVFRFTPPIGNTKTGQLFSTMDFMQSDFVLREVTIGMSQGIVTSIAAKYPNGITWRRGSKSKDQAFYKLSKLGTEGIISASITYATEIGNGVTYLVGIKLFTNRGKSLVVEDPDAERVGHNRRKMGNKVFKDFETVFLNAPVAKGSLVGFWGASRETMAKTPVEIPAIYRLGCIWSAPPLGADEVLANAVSEEAEIGVIRTATQKSENAAVVSRFTPSITTRYIAPELHYQKATMSDMGNPRMGSILVKTAHTFNVFMGLARMDLAPQENFRISTRDDEYVEGQQYKIHLGTPSQEAQLNSAEACWLSFAKDDDRIQAGRFDWCSDSAWHLRTPGERYTKRIQFKKPFKQIPKITTAITYLDCFLGNAIGVSVSASSIDSQGFSLELQSSAGKYRLLLDTA
ncbi:hypothetical protein QFC22_005111 [Naganishia vaughanmartiniae]|uniref:Uncharacterized protein n=1 Tax=Naganishia vaughanmartiniae TaxID=1424756 RepID=A0ACC2WWX4_9TREE|nr:hypothetical protein QFC22_005111 [Naganishia vaughanmartiniae]